MGIDWLIGYDWWKFLVREVVGDNGKVDDVWNVWFSNRGRL